MRLSFLWFALLKIQTFLKSLQTVYLVHFVTDILRG